MSPVKIRIPCLAALAAGALAAGPLAAGAQAVYRIVGPDGQVTFSDRPPADGRKASELDPSGRGNSSGNGQLPFELRQLVSRFPVTLYTGDGCVPCTAGRAQLIRRGVPFTEYTVKSAEDLQALQRLTGEATIPVLTIGAQRLKGYSSAEWTQYLDAAGYPDASRLPSGYRNPPARPLVAPAPQPPASEAPASPPPAALPPPPADPDRIVF